MKCSERELDDILKKSRENNIQKGITGILAYHEGNFIQLLEGEKQDVTALYEKIAKDDRHCFIEKILEGYNAAKEFPDWSMAFKNLTAEEYRDVEGKLHLNVDAISAHMSTEDKKYSPILATLRRFIAS